MNLPESRLERAWAVVVALIVALLAVGVVDCWLRGFILPKTEDDDPLPTLLGCVSFLYTVAGCTAPRTGNNDSVG